MKDKIGRLAMPWKNEYDRLAIYNSEVHRGLIHTDKYKLEMKKIQKEFNMQLEVYYEK